MRKPGGLPGCLFLRATSIVGGWWKYMCKVFLREIASVDGSFVGSRGGWGVDNDFGCGVNP